MAETKYFELLEPGSFQAYHIMSMVAGRCAGAQEDPDTNESWAKYENVDISIIRSSKPLPAAVEDHNQVSDNLWEFTVEELAEDYSNPNPTYGMVTIDTQLSNDAKSASIIIRSLEGIEEKRVSLNVDSQSVSLDLSNLKNGIHLVTLIVDGNISDSTRLVKE